MVTSLINHSTKN